MKKCLPAALCLVLLCACAHRGGTAATQPTPPPVGDTAPPAAFLSCRIVDGAETGRLLLAAAEGSDIYSVSADAMEATVPQLRDGMWVTLSYDGAAGESWPAQLHVSSILPEEDQAVDDRCGLYLQVLEDLWAETGPHGGAPLKYVGLDLSGLTHLTQAERSAVAWRFAELHGLELVTGTWTDLTEQGYLVSVHLDHGGDNDPPGGAFEHWPDGVFFSLDTDEDAVWSLPALMPGEEPPVLTAFTARTTQRSDLDSVRWNCTGRQGEDGTWSYSIAPQAAA